MLVCEREFVRVEKIGERGGAREAAGARVNSTSEDAQFTRTE